VAKVTEPADANPARAPVDFEEVIPILKARSQATTPQL
jgi:hypothetical protein